MFVAYDYKTRSLLDIMMIMMKPIWQEVDSLLKIDGQAGIDCTDERRRTELEQFPPHNLAKFAHSNFAKLSVEIKLSVFIEIQFKEQSLPPC